MKFLTFRLGGSNRNLIPCLFYFLIEIFSILIFEIIKSLKLLFLVFFAAMCFFTARLLSTIILLSAHIATLFICRLDKLCTVNLFNTLILLINIIILILLGQLFKSIPSKILRAISRFYISPLFNISRIFRCLVQPIEIRFRLKLRISKYALTKHW